MLKVSHHSVFEIRTSLISEMFVYKHRETIEYVKKLATCEENCKLHG